MGMTTAIVTKDGKNRLKFVTEQYQVGLYVAIYDADENWRVHGTPAQAAVHTKELQYHKNLRKKIARDPEVVLDEEHSTPI